MEGTHWVTMGFNTDRMAWMMTGVALYVGQAEAHRLAVEQWKSIPRNTDGKDWLSMVTRMVLSMVTLAAAVGI